MTRAVTEQSHARFTDVGGASDACGVQFGLYEQLSLELL